MFLYYKTIVILKQNPKHTLEQIKVTTSLISCFLILKNDQSNLESKRDCFKLVIWKKEIPQKNQTHQTNLSDIVF